MENTILNDFLNVFKLNAYFINGGLSDLETDNVQVQAEFQQYKVRFKKHVCEMARGIT